VGVKPGERIPPGREGRRTHGRNGRLVRGLLRTLLSSLREPRLVAKSRTTITESGLLDLPSGTVAVFRKTYSYRGLGPKARGMFRTTFLAPGRAARESEALLRLGALGLAPDPVARVERRTLGFLDEAMLAVRAVEGGRDLSVLPCAPGLPAALGAALGRIHAAGLGRLDGAPRNWIAAPAAGGWEIRKVDSGSLAEVPRGGREQAADLEELLAGLAGRWTEAEVEAVRGAYPPVASRP
jgi:hypothetical protein